MGGALSGVWLLCFRISFVFRRSPFGFLSSFVVLASSCLYYNPPADRYQVREIRTGLQRLRTAASVLLRIWDFKARIAFLIRISLRLRLHYAKPHLGPVAADLRHIHRVTSHRQRMELAGDFGPQIVANLP